MDENMLDRQGPCLSPRVVRRLCLEEFVVADPPYWTSLLCNGEPVSLTGTNLGVLSGAAADHQHAPLHEI